MTSLEEDLSDLEVEEKEFYDNIDYIGGMLKIIIDEYGLFDKNEDGESIQRYKFACQKLGLRDRIHNNIRFLKKENEEDYEIYVKWFGSPILEYTCLYRDILKGYYNDVIITEPIIIDKKPNEKYRIKVEDFSMEIKDDVFLYIRTNFSEQANAILNEYLKENLTQIKFSNYWIIKNLGFEYVYRSISLNNIKKFKNLKILDLSRYEIDNNEENDYDEEDEEDEKYIYEDNKDDKDYEENIIIMNNILENGLSFGRNKKIVVPVEEKKDDGSINFLLEKLKSLSLLSVTRLELYKNQITYFPEGVFDGLFSLTFLDLSANQLTTLPEGIFDKLTSLKYLYLYENQLTTLPEGIFDKLTSLTHLNLSENQLRILPEGVFDDLTSLTSLDLKINYIRILPNRVFDKLTFLTFLNLTSNNFENIPKGVFDKLRLLDYLNLSDNSFNNIPNGVFNNLNSLTYLNLSYNHFDNLPDNVFNNLQLLDYLNLSRTNIINLPANIFNNLNSLTHLDLRDNRRLMIPENAFHNLYNSCQIYK